MLLSKLCTSIKSLIHKSSISYAFWVMKFAKISFFKFYEFFNFFLKTGGFRENCLRMILLVLTPIMWLNFVLNFGHYYSFLRKKKLKQCPIGLLTCNLYFSIQEHVFNKILQKFTMWKLIMLNIARPIRIISSTMCLNLSSSTNMYKHV